MAMKNKAILLNNDFSGVEKEMEIEGGMCKIDLEKENKYEFFTDKATPITVKYENPPFDKGKYSFYMFNWKSLIPVEFEEKEKEVSPKEVEPMLKKEGMTEEQIQEVKKNIEEKEKEEGKKITKYVCRWLQPVEITEKHWSQADKHLPKILRQTADMRFLAHLKKYDTESGGTGTMKLGKVGIAVLGIAVMGFFLVWGLISGGVITLG